MNNRFDSLISSTPQTKSSYKSNSRNYSNNSNNLNNPNNPNNSERVNTFKQKKTNRNEWKYRNNVKENNPYRSKNSFVKAKLEEFEIKSENFPTLNGDDKCLSNTNKNLDELNYLEKTKLYKIKMSEKQLVPPGWKILTRNSVDHLNTSKPININSVSDNQSEYYNPRLAMLILYNREKQREELNDILGDISPYWNIHELNEEDDDYDDYDDYDSYDSYDDEYVDDIW